MEVVATDPGRSPASARPDAAPVGVLMVNLGSPSAPTPAAVRRFLAEFLGDPLVVDLNPIVWWLVRHLIVLPFRSRSSARLYRSIWTAEGSPLLTISRRQQDALARELGLGQRVELAMRYGEPSIADGLRRLMDAGCRRVRLLPMFPQASCTTTGTIEREAERVLAGMADAPELESVQPYFEHPAYVEALALRVREELERGEVDHVFLSFHGLPVRLIESGDLYRDHCEATARALARALELADSTWTLAYQSRFGRERWLGPDVAELVPEMAARGRRVLVACPGFTADCLETLEEIALRLCAAVRERGGEEPRVVPCLNDHPAWISGLARIVREETAQPIRSSGSGHPPSAALRTQHGESR